MTAEEIGVKFTALGKGIVGEARCRQLSEHIMKMDQAGSVTELMRLMTK